VGSIFAAAELRKSPQRSELPSLSDRPSTSGTKRTIWVLYRRREQGRHGILPHQMSGRCTSSPPQLSGKER
jgi:hypothetical protein